MQRILLMKRGRFRRCCCSITEVKAQGELCA
nr:MAG TPA: hypothetical protein [Caudoviricetes sp.]